VLFLTWLALAFFLFAVAAAAVFAVRRGFALFRAIGAGTAALGDGVARVTEAADETARAAEALPARTEELTAELERLSESRRQLGVLAGAFAGVRRSTTGLRTAFLGK